ncbi:LLM class flavin-dependent oxidoreductase [Brachybacterium sp. Z12]|uniref:LLM class flavin-dependent oxidoreductase n=1 Tax=Brachybacterium sp. Z12 TaxID=2759167 RepID=UPI00186053DA|nr:LLM class flavin-dependent oxidoreductase [Brachybacterium sp. Z12]QNN82247.1 LLM class flavin-dependent oxidoreductase [Brachybacterium sp. Z12]
MAEILGMLSSQRGSETDPVTGPAVDPGWIREFARAHEEAGFDRVLIGYSSASPDGFALASAVLQATEHLGVLIAHRPGFVAPTVVARKLATLDQLSGGGRVAIHHISGGSDADQARDGDFSTKPERYRRTAEFMDLLRRALDSHEPLDYSGEHYRVQDAQSAVHPVTPGGIPLWFGGLSEDAVQVGGEHADVYALFGETKAEVAGRTAEIRRVAAAAGNEALRFSLSTRPVVAETEEAAWEKADAYLEQARTLKEAGAVNNPLRLRRHAPSEPTAVSADRLQRLAHERDVHDERLWFGITKLMGPQGNSSGHVGTGQQVADALLEYWDLGVENFLIRGFDQLGDVQDWGELLIPALRAGIAEKQAAQREVLAGV